jgi:hypothetical protein
MIVRPAVLGLALLAVASPGKTLAGPIRSHHLHIATFQDSVSLEAYFRQALAKHSLRVRIPSQLRALRADANGLLPETAFVEYLRWRHSLNPERFDRVHPKIGPMIEHDTVLRTAMLRPPSPTPFPQVLTIDSTTRVPEPSAGFIALVLIASGAWARRSALRAA